jgi:hypothetical protein
MVVMATSILMDAGILANLVNKPNKINTPQTISKMLTNEPRNSDDGSSIFSNRSVL